MIITKGLSNYKVLFCDGSKKRRCHMDLDWSYYIPWLVRVIPDSPAAAEERHKCHTHCIIQLLWASSHQLHDNFSNVEQILFVFLTAAFGVTHRQ